MKMLINGRRLVDTDGLSWTQVIDTKHELYNSFMLSSLPSNFLLNPDGKIIAKNVDGETLKEHLVELLVN